MLTETEKQYFDQLAAWPVGGENLQFLRFLADLDEITFRFCKGSNVTYRLLQTRTAAYSYT